MLKILMKKRELDRLNKELAELREKSESFESREAELESDINEVESEEETKAVEEAVDEFEKEKEETASKIADLEGQVGEIEREIEEAEAKTEEVDKKVEEERKDIPEMNERTVDKMDIRSIVEDEQMKELLFKVRTAIKEKRAIEGGSVLIPEVALGLLRQNIEEYSKLIKHVNLRQISGNGTEVVMGTIPEAVWTDCCGNINDLSLTFNDAEVACWKVGGYFDVCNATLEDNDIQLATELVTVLGQAIGMALDKAIIYGLGTRMPLGIVTRLAQTSKPADYPATARTWVDLHSSNIIKINKTGVELFQAIIEDSALSKGEYSRGERVWVMNEKTYTYLKSQGLSINAAGAIVSGIDGAMPVAGGVVEVLDFVPDYDVITGYFDLYLLAERAGTTIGQSEHVMFLNDRTVFKGTARYDGLPVIAEGFVLLNVKNTNPTTSVNFAPDDANADVSE